MTAILVPDTAPFSEEQRAWLNGFLSGLMGLQSAQPGVTGEPVAVAEVEEDLDDAAWHDATLPILDRMQLAEGKPLGHRLMAAMAQLDCGSCGYVCQSYSAAIASGEESDLTLCSPGGKETKQMLKTLVKENATATTSLPAKLGGLQSDPAQPGDAKLNGGLTWTRKNPFPATLLESRPLNRNGSSKDTRHVAIDLSGSGVEYEVGDALGIFPENCGELVNDICNALEISSHHPVASRLGHSKPLGDSLMEDYCLKDPSDELLELLLAGTQSATAKATIQTLLDEGVPDGFDVLDALLLARVTTLSAQEFVDALSPLNPRLYSIASSMRSVGQQVHLTVGKVVYEREGRVRRGAASCMLAERSSAGSKLRVFVQPNHGGFTVPADSATPMIMIGPGTGIAPFMAFLQERASTQASGKNWLFFGDQHEASDFLYQDALEDYRAQGLLTRLDTAFSRDADKKIYVQDRMLEHALEFWKWLEEGAHVYVCGDASRMAADVERALKTIIATHGQRSEAEAAEYLKQLARQKRYVRDVY